MRLNCPNCGAQYEVEASVIPETGRDVQCSNCGHTWFQGPEDADDEFYADLAEATAAAEAADEPDADSGDGRPRRPLDPKVSDILREEAAREVAARRGDAGSLESQPDLGLDETAVGEDADGRATADVAPRSARFPDIEDVDTSLDRQKQVETAAEPAGAAESDETTSDTEEAAAEPYEEAAADGRRGFRRGFSLTVLIIAIGVLVYYFAPQIAEMLPQTEPYLIAYVDWANRLRDILDSGVQALIEQFRSLLGGDEA